MPDYLDDAACRLLAKDAHAGQVDKQGRDYFIYHVAVVAHVAEPLGARVVQAAYLHDVIEDTNISGHDLLFAGVDPVVVAAVNAVSRRDGETYRDLIERSCSHPVGVLVKLVDNAVNVAACRAWDDDSARRMEATRYVPARKRLAAAADLSVDELDAQVSNAAAALAALP